MASFEVFKLFNEVVYCCGVEHSCRVYELPTTKVWKRLFFLDECGLCGEIVATLQECNHLGSIRTLERKKGKEAVILRDKLLKSLKDKPFQPRNGSIENERVLYNNKGIIYNFNNFRVGKNSDFVESSEVINIKTYST